MLKRSNFYPNGEIIAHNLPQSFQRSLRKENCSGVDSTVTIDNSVDVWGAKFVRENYICHEWRKRFFKR